MVCDIIRVVLLACLLGGVFSFNVCLKRAGWAYLTSSRIESGLSSEDLTYDYELVSGIDKIGQEAWNKLLLDTDSPFVEYEWINALESTGLASTDTGWQPVHLCLWRSGMQGGVASLTWL